jgi:hypothetical protein
MKRLCDALFMRAFAEMARRAEQGANGSENRSDIAD